jgi:mono/diheme cytochrome c family protein
VVSPARRFTALGLLLFLAAFAALTLGSCSGKVASGSVDGKEVFAAACANCHGPEGTPPPSMAAQLGVRDLRSAEFRARATVALIEHQVRAGSPNKLMPAFAGALGEEQIRAVAEHVAALTPVTPKVPAK